MKRFVIITFSFWLAGFFTAFGQLDKELLKEISTWKKGAPPPARLLRFPDDWKCDNDAGWLGSSVDDYIQEIKDTDLLAKLLFDSRTQTDCFRAAVRRFISLKGVDGLAKLVADEQEVNASVAVETPSYRVSSIFEKPDLAVLTQLLHSHYVAVKVACITKNDMESKKAASVLRNMGAELAAGRKWKDVYEKFSDANPDMRYRAKNPKSVRTLVGYRFDGVVSPCGFDIMSFTMVQFFPQAHLKELFRAKQGHHVIETSDAVYLYYIEAYFNGFTNKASEAIVTQDGAQPQR